MRRVVIGMAVAAALFVSRYAGADDWEISADLSLNVTQNAYSDNWTGGEVGSIAWTSLANAIAERQLSDKYHWRNVGRFGFGQTHNQNADTDKWETPEKSTDKIDIESVLKMTLGAVVDPYVAFRFESQFLDNSVPEVKRVINPILLTESAGASRNLYKRDKDEIITRVGFAVRQHVDRTVVSVNPNETSTETTTDGGLEWVTDAKYTISPERLRYEGKLTLFQAAFYSEADELKGLPNENYWKAPDVNWESLFIAGITRYVQVTLYTQLLYDKEIDRGGRFKETLAMGLTYKLF